MKVESTPVMLALVAMMACGTVRGQEPTPGKVVVVTCKKNPEQSYGCYLPKTYTPKRRWPILYCWSPVGHADVYVKLVQAVCERRGWIAVGSMQSKNGPWPPIKEAIEAVWEDSEARLSLSERARFATGFSGGARVSFALAEMHPEQIAGVIAVGAGLPTNGALPRNELAVYLLCGETDMNRRELDALAPRLEAAGNPVAYQNFPGGHVMSPTPLLEAAVEWLDDRSAESFEKRVSAGLAGVRAQLEAGDGLEAWLELQDLVMTFGEPASQRSAIAMLRRELEADPAVKKEKAARKALDEALAWIEKNAARIAEYQHVRATAIKKLQRIIKRYPDGPSAAEATRQIALLR